MSARRRPFPSSCSRALAVIGSALGALVAASPASATTFCVPNFTAACPNNGTNVAQASLDTALTTNGSDGSADTIILAGQFFATTTTFTPFGSDPLTITGAGAGSTFLGSSAGSNVAVISLINRAGATTISNLTAVVGANHPDNGGVGIQADAGTTLRDVEVDVRNPASVGGSGTPGITLGGSATLERVRIGSSGGGVVGAALSIGGSTSTVVSATQLTIENPATSGIDLQDGAQLTANRVAITGVSTVGVLVRPGTVTLTNLLLTGGSAVNAVGVSAPGAGNAQLTLDHATIVATSPSVEAPIRVTSTSTGNATVTTTNSIVSGFASGGQRLASGTGLARFNASYSYLPGPVGGSAGGGGITLTNMIATAPTFVDASGFDYGLAAGSSAIDAGTPGTAAPPSTSTAMPG